MTFSTVRGGSGVLGILALLALPAPAQEQPLAEEVVFFEEPNRSKAFEMLERGEMHVYAVGLSDPEIKRKIEASKDVTYTMSYGNNWELTINPAGPVFTNGKLNPFGVAKIREALNWLIDRDYIAQELCFGLARPKYVPLSSAFPDYARLADVCRQVEIEYAQDPDRAKQVIAVEMEKLGAVKKNGRWHYKDAPVLVLFLIRTEDVRKRIGDYIAGALEDAGFSVDRQYKTAAETSPIWIGSDPKDGKWHLYTGGWINTLINRDQGENFNYYYTKRGRPDTLWQAYHPSPRFDEISDRLTRNDYKTWDERMQLMAEAVRTANRECFRLWLVDAINYFPLRKDVRISSDLAGGINGSFLWPYTSRFVGAKAPRMRIGMPSILTEAWNPVAGSNWVYDRMIAKGTYADATLPDPFTGLFWPNRLISAEILAEQGTPIAKTLDWVKLEFVPSIQVPTDAWIGWDGKAQRIVTVGDKHPGGLKARTKSTLRFADDMWKRRWHDGTTQTFADYLIGWMITFERVSKTSPLFDDAAVPLFESWEKFFRGQRIVSEDPLVVEYYSDQSYLDAEMLAFQNADSFYGSSTSPPTPWTAMVPGLMAESDQKLAFSADKAEKLKADRMSYLAGPSLPVLEQYLKKAEAEAYIPYETVLGKYVTKDQARERYAALRRFYEKRKHFWVGNGPYVLESVYTLEKTVVLRRFEEYREADPRWLGFTEPRIAEVQVVGPARVTIGEPAEFAVQISWRGAPYPVKDIDFVKFLLFDAKRRLVLAANAEAVRDGEWIARLPAEKTKELKPGTNRLEIAVAPRVVSIASFANARFVSLGGR